MEQATRTFLNCPVLVNIDKRQAGQRRRNQLASFRGIVCVSFASSSSSRNGALTEQ
jgi:hypothetical protein